MNFAYTSYKNIIGCTLKSYTLMGELIIDTNFDTVLNRTATHNN